MFGEHSLKNIPLDELLKMFSEITKKIVEAKINNDESMVADHQKTLEQIQEAIIIKRAEEKPLR